MLEYYQIAETRPLTSEEQLVFGESMMRSIGYCYASLKRGSSEGLERAPLGAVETRVEAEAVVAALKSADLNCTFRIGTRVESDANLFVPHRPKTSE